MTSMHCIMKVYALGSHGQSDTQGKVIITIELVPNHTDIKGLTLFKGQHMNNPFYRELKINCGKIIKVSDLSEKKDFETVTVKTGTINTNISIGKYFDIREGSSYITAFQYKIAVLEASGYVARNYTGCAYTHYESGLIKTKSYYKDGNLVSVFHNRDDPFNTLQYVRQFKNSIIECEFSYDERESLIRQTWYNSKGDVFLDTGLPSNTERAPPIPIAKPSPSISSTDESFGFDDSNESDLHNEEDELNTGIKPADDDSYV